MRREDILALTREYYSASPTYQRTRTRVRFTLPALMLCLWLFTFSTSGFDWIATVMFPGAGALWYFFYPARFDRRVERYAEKTLDEEAHTKSRGPCELTLSDAGLHSKSNTGESTFYWSAVDRVLLTDCHLFIFLAGSMAYPIPIADIGADAAKSAYDYAISRKSTIV